MINNSFDGWTKEQLDQYNELCIDYPQWAVDMLIDLYGPNELFDGIVTDLEEYSYML